MMTKSDNEDKVEDMYYTKNGDTRSDGFVWER